LQRLEHLTIFPPKWIEHYGIGRDPTVARFKRPQSLNCTSIRTCYLILELYCTCYFVSVAVGLFEYRKNTDQRCSGSKFWGEYLELKKKC